MTRSHLRTGIRNGIVVAILGMVFLNDVSELAADPRNQSNWQLDVLRLRNGATLSGMIEVETPTHVRFQLVQRKAGRPTVSFHTTISTEEIVGIDRLTPQQRKQLKAQLDGIAQAGQQEQIRSENLLIEPIDWQGKPGAGLRYVSDFFVLNSDAPEALVRRTAVRLEQIYAAYTRFLQPRFRTRRPTTIWLFRNREGYAKEMQGIGRPILNPACFDPRNNRVLCFSDLDRMAEDLERIRKHHLDLWTELDRQQKEITRLYPNPKERERFIGPIEETRRKIISQNQKNDEIVDRATTKLFAVLYHESFHAYVENYVFPEGVPNGLGPLPTWLNEGLAQIFETGILELGEFRVGHAERGRLLRIKELVRKNELVPIKDLLRATPKSFAVLHADEAAASDRYYLTSWGLAFYLTFEKRLLGAAALEAFIASEGKTDRIVAFEKLLQQPIDRIEADFQRYLRNLQENGSTVDLETMRDPVKPPK
ncbi:DUF1570 domain-containing protein [Tuwongella immobilis]|uniref:DUF1570 domain-containing protein n=1 Tax=Tuwongella immobilis TaxID=692036 RepID=A0A6C2YPE0_9BACT|nr:DUF1570 domain-containing protein [Tuwongella immobilis]VIP03490.1 Uncharacterized protein OS=Blastopirellula marina DSM 3645 GN=DSM3645_17000 PE=4 SV=1: Peptidase_MA_2 [Tuwongella immobilis]VTS04349.1 Uncharacterized protein OS=Blastopirellula marina DSM 3645 GN=DSM3645_17000 PE=4 SV=1: Peptidase_MA_2 [Tuwongella immobilis]